LTGVTTFKGKGKYEENEKKKKGLERVRFEKIEGTTPLLRAHRHAGPGKRRSQVKERKRQPPRGARKWKGGGELRKGSWGEKKRGGVPLYCNNIFVSDV